VGRHASRLAAMFVAIGLLSQSTTAQQSGHAFVAVARHDGSMIPVAVFDGHKWWDRWPAPSPQDELPPVPPTSASVPSDWLPPGIQLPTQWRLLRPNKRVVPIKVLRPIRTWMLAEDVIGLQIDYEWKHVPEDLDAALAVSGRATVGRFIPASRRESDAVAAQLAERLATIERLEMGRWVEAAERASETSVKLRRVFRDPDQQEPAPLSLVRAERPFNGRTYYHLTGEKLYADVNARDPSCKLNMSFEGVVATDRKGRVVFENVSAFAWDGYCGDAARWNDAIAMVQVNDQLFWIGVENLEDGFSYFVRELVPTTGVSRQHHAPR